MDLIRAYASGLLPEVSLFSLGPGFPIRIELRNEALAGICGMTVIKFESLIEGLPYNPFIADKQAFMSARKLCQRLLELYEKQEQTCEPSP